MKSIRKIELKWSRVSTVKDGEAEYSKHVSNSTDTTDLIKALIGDEVHEVLIVLHLNTKNKIVGYNEASRGGIAGSSVTPADVFRAALLSGASKIIVAHNHPSGEPQPSAEDIAFTKRIRHAGEILGVKLLDHVIIGDESSCSLLDIGEL